MIRPGLSSDPDAVEEHFTEKNGFLTGKSAAIADWQHRKEERAFGVLVNRLRVRKWQKENPERRRAIALRYARKPDVVVKQCAREKARRRQAFKANTPVHTCEQCGAQWCRVPVKGRLPRGMTPRFCGDACAQINRYRAKAAPSGKRCSGCGETGHNRRRCRAVVA